MIGHAPVGFVFAIGGFGILFFLLACVAAATGAEKAGCVLAAFIAVAVLVLLTGGIGFGLFLG